MCCLSANEHEFCEKHYWNMKRKNKIIYLFIAYDHERLLTWHGPTNIQAYKFCLLFYMANGFEFLYYSTSINFYLNLNLPSQHRAAV